MKESPKKQVIEESELTVPLAKDVTETRANAINKWLEKDPIFQPLLGLKTVPVYRKLGAKAYHYQATIEIARLMSKAGIEVIKAPKRQIIQFACNYFNISVSSPDETSTVSVKAKSKATESETSKPPATVTATVVAAPATAVVAPAPSPTPAAVIPSPATATVSAGKPRLRDEACEVKDPEVEERRRREIYESPATGVYTLLLNALQLAKLDKAKGCEQRVINLDRVAREYFRAIPSYG